jgi:hypothetical protein
MSRLSVALTTLIARWKQESVKLLPPVDPAALQAVLCGLSVPIAQDVVELYSMIGGMPDGEMDANMFCLWPLDQVLSERPKSPSSHVEFADYMIDSFRYAWEQTDAETSAVFINFYSVEGEAPTVACNSITKFFEQYAAASNENEATRALHETEPR